MDIPDDEFLRQLLATFRVEAEEHLQAISSGLLELEKTPPDDQRTHLIETIFREAHSLKGAARAVSLTEIETICQQIEDIFATWKRGEQNPTPEHFTTLHQTLDLIGQLLGSTSGVTPGMGRKELNAQLEHLARLKNPVPPETTPLPRPPPELVEIRTQPPPEPETPPPPAPEPKATAPQPPPSSKPFPASQALAARGKEPLADTIRISSAKLDALLLKAEETVAMKLNTSQRASDLHEIEALLDEWDKHWSRITPELDTIHRTLDKQRLHQGETSSPSIDRTTTFFDWSHARFKILQEKIHALTRSVDHDSRALSAMVDNLLEETKKLLMLPFSMLLGVLPRIIRDLAYDQGKEVQLLIRGSDVEIDKRILEELKDPLIHLLRNSIDHGIEKPSIRTNQGKPKLATVTIAINQISGSEVEILVTDDGQGINIAAVKAVAVKRGIVTDADAAQLDDTEAISLIFQSGVSTSPLVTEISGRGLGLAIVSEKVSKLNGHISVDTVPHHGTTFRILLPLTLATFKGVIIHAGNQCFVLPTANLERVKFVHPEDVKTIENRESIVTGNRVIALVTLADLLDIPRAAPSASEPHPFPAIVLSSGDKRIAFRVDEVVNEQEILVKPLGKPLIRVRNVAGATVLGTGNPAVILNTADLIQSAMKSPTLATPTTEVTSPTAPKSLLLVEDSITARMLLKNILETAGYHVKTAVDGLDAWTTLATDTFDAVLTDVDMPRMNGFELTRKIRDDDRLKSLPVVLVTGRESRKDRELGIDAGANAYLIKSSFDQSNLLEVVERLI